MLLEKSYRLDDLEVLNVLKHPVWILRCDDPSEIDACWANTSYMKLFNSPSLEAFVARKIGRSMTESTQHRVRENLRRCHGGQVLSEQATLYPDGVPTVVNISCSGIRLTVNDNNNNNNNKQIVALLCEAEVAAEYQDSTVRGLEMLRHLPVPACQFDASGQHLYRNPEAVRVYGATEKKLQDHFVDRTLGEQTYQQVLREENLDQDVHVPTAELTTADQGNRWFSVVIRRTRDPVHNSEDGSVLLMTARDITEVLEIRRERATLHHKAEFLAVLAHDIRTPLHQIIGCMDLLETTGNQLTLEQKEQVNIAQFSAASLVGITTDLLDYSKLESGKLQLDHQSFDLGTFLEGCIAAVRQDAEEKGLKLILTMNNDIPSKKVMGDPYRLRRILLNLLENAIKYTEKGSVSLTTSKLLAAEDTTTTIVTPIHGEAQSLVRIRFEIMDTGIGLSTKEQGIVFEKYRTGVGQGAKNYEGTGLGLPICRGLVEAMGGTIGVKSGLGKGASFHFEIPFGVMGTNLEEEKKVDVTKSENDGGEEAKTETPKPSEKENFLKVLVAEDNKINPKVVRSMLQRIGHTVTIAENGLLAVEAIKTNRNFDLVLMDRMMPEMDGIQASLAIRAMGITKSQLPIVGLTASFQQSELGFYLENGMNDCLGKPIKLASLKRAITDAMQNRLTLQ